MADTSKKESRARSSRSYALKLQRRALTDIAVMTAADRESAAVKLRVALDYSSPMREEVFIDLIVQEIKSRRKKEIAA